MIPDYHKATFATIMRAAAAADLSLLECVERTTGKSVVVLCAVLPGEVENTYLPLAKLFESDPMQELVPNIPEGI